MAQSADAGADGPSEWVSVVFPYETTVKTPEAQRMIEPGRTARKVAR